MAWRPNWRIAPKRTPRGRFGRASTAVATIVALITALLPAIAQLAVNAPKAAAATSTVTEAPNSDGNVFSGSWTLVGCSTNTWQCLNDYPDSSGTTYITGPNKSNSAYVHKGFTTTGADVGSVTSVDVQYYAKQNSTGVSAPMDLTSLSFDLELSDQSTIVTNVGTSPNLTTTLTGYTTTLTPNAVDISKVTADNWMIKIKQNYTVQGTADTTADAFLASVQLTVHYITANGTLTQSGYIFENDDQASAANANSDTAQAAGNTAITGVQKGERVNLRTQLKGATTATATNMGLFYDRNDNYWTKVKSSAVPVTGSGTCADTNFNCAALAGHYTATPEFSSVAVGPNGTPWVSFYDSNAKDLIVANYVGSGGSGCGAAGSSSWNCVTVVSTGDVGKFNKILVDTSGNVWVMYFNVTSTSIMVAENVAGAGCASSAWTCTTVQTSITEDTTGTFSENAFDIDGSGVPEMQYADDTLGISYTARYVGSGGTGCATAAWGGCANEEVDDGVATQMSGAIGPNSQPWSIQNTSGSLYYYKYVGGAGGCGHSLYTCALLDGTNSGEFADMAVDPSGNPWVSWHDTTNDQLKVSTYVGSGGNCPGDAAFNCTDVDNTTSIGPYSSIAFDAVGHAWVVYKDATNNRLRLARYVGSGGTGCTSGLTTWSCTTVDSVASKNIGDWASIAFGPDGTAWITTVNQTDKDVRIIQLNHGGEVLTSPGLGTNINGATITSSHADMTSVSDSANQSDADCIGGGTWTNGGWFDSEEASGLSIPSGDCTEVDWALDTSQVQDNKTYRFTVATKDSTNYSRSFWRGPATISQTPSLTTATSTTIRDSKDDLAGFSANCTDTNWTCDGVKTTGGAGGGSSMAFGPSGTPYVAYVNTSAGNEQLWIAQYVGPGNGDATCSSNAWKCSVVDNTSGKNEGYGQISLKIAPDGTKWIAYEDQSDLYLRVAWSVASGGNCAASSWSCATVDSGGTDRYMSLALDNLGNPWISYSNQSTLDLKLARFLGTNATNGSGCAVTNWTCRTIDSTNSRGNFTGIAFDKNNDPWIAYWDSTANGQRVAQYVGVGGTGCDSGVTDWTCTAVLTGFTSTSAGWAVNPLAIDASGNPWIVAYNDNATPGTLYAMHYKGAGSSGGTCNGTLTSGSASWDCETITTNTTGTAKATSWSGVGSMSTIGIDAAGDPWVTYSATSGEQATARRIGSSGSGCASTAWTGCNILDGSSSGVTAYPSIAFDRSGEPWVSYGNSVNTFDDLYVAKLKLPQTAPSYNDTMANPGTNAIDGDLRYRLDAGLSPRTSTCAATANHLGYCGVSTYDSGYDSMAGSAYETPMYDFATRSTSNSSYPSYAWTGQSNIAASTSNVVLQIYDIATASWVTLKTNSTASANTDMTLVGTASSGATSDYWQTDGSNYWTYYRVYQVASSSAQTLKTQYFTTATPTFVTGQSASAVNNALNTSIAATFPSSTKLGDLIVATATWDDTNTQTISCSDGNGNSYSNAVLVNDVSIHQAIGTCYATVTTAGASTVTVTFAGQNASYRGITIAEYTGVATAAPLDVTANNPGATGTTATDNVTTNSNTTTTNNDLVTGGFVTDCAPESPLTAGTNDTLRTVATSCATNDYSYEDRVLATAGSVAMTETYSSSQTYLAGMAAFHPYGTPLNTAPNAPTSLTQYRSDGTTGIPATTQYSFDSTLNNNAANGSWHDDNGGTVSLSTTQVRTGSNALKVVTGGTWAQLNDGNGTLHDGSTAGPTLSAWVYVPSSDTGGSWSAELGVQDSGYTYRYSAGVTLTRDTWNLVTFTPAKSLLQNMRAYAIWLTGGTGAGDTVYVDDLQQGYGQYTNQTTLVFKGSVSDPDNPDTDQLCVEVKPIASAFDGSTNITCGTGVATSGSPATASVTVSGLSDATSYHWRAETKDAGALTSSWVSYGGNSETTADFIIDTTSPSTGTVKDGSSAGVESTFNSGSLSSLSCNWSGFSDSNSGIATYDYSIGTTAGATNVLGWTNADTNAVATATGLTLHTSQTYYCNVRANDGAGNTSSVVSSPGQLVAPTLTFTTSTNVMSFNLSAGNGYTDSHTMTLTTSTNAYNGYAIQGYETAPMTYGSHTIADYASPASSPTTWSGNGFGYNMSGGASVAAFSGSKYAHFGVSASPDTPVANAGLVSGTPISNEQETATLKMAVAATQPAGSYATTIVWTCLPVY